MNILTGKEYHGGTHLPQSDYERLDADITENEAKAIINRNFGFEFSRIEIVTTASTYYAENHRIYKDQTFTRKPQYEATDWNYIRFNCAGWKWEMIDGDLYAYED